MTFYEENLRGKAKRISVFAFIAAAGLAVAAFSLYMYVQIIEIKELGDKFLQVFQTNFLSRAVAQTISFIVTFALFYISTFFVCRNVKKTDSPVLYIIDNPWRRVLVCVLLSVVASAFISEAVYSRYLLFANSTEFGSVDPIFGNDIGYYVFIRPFLDALVGSVISVWVIVTLYCVAVYTIIYAVNGLLKFKHIPVEKPVVVHNTVNIVICFLLMALTYKFRSEQVLYSNIGEFAGAGYTDINVWYNFYRVAPFLLIAIVAVAVFFLAKGKYKHMIITAAIYPAVLIAVSVVSFSVQTLIVEPNEAVKERPYLEHNMTYTKLAFGIDDVRQEEYPASAELDVSTISPDSFNSIRVTDFESSLNAVKSLQGIRNYYKFSDADVTKYTLDGKPTLVSVAAREIDKDNIPDSAKNYANEVLRFTHGFGAVMTPLNEVTAEGQPKFIIKDIPSVSSQGAPVLTQPRIYYGETDDDYVIVNSSLKEIDYYDNSEEVEFSYDGSGGIRLGVFNRILYAAKNGDFRMLISQFVGRDSKILINRNVKERVQKAAPFLKFDDDPYMIVDSDGTLKWVIDAYTTSVYYPYSQNYDGFNYIRNSAKAVVDAYNGSIDIYITDRADPVIRTYEKIYPDIFSDEEIPSGISEHIVYPEYLFKIQAEVYGKYHVSNPNTLYNKSDLWVFAREKHGSDERDIVPYYNLMDVSEIDGKQNFIIMIPYTLTNKDNMVGWLAASCDGANYGRLVSYHFPKGKNVYGTMQIENRIDSDPSISREMTLWGQGGSNVIRGNMLVVPIGGSLIYIEPIYISSSAEKGSVSGSIPELKRVIVAYGDKIVMEPTLKRALEVIFEGKAPTGPVGTLEGIEEDSLDKEGEPSTEKLPQISITLDEVIDKIIDGYNAASESSAKGNWSGFGENMQKLDEAIKELEKYRAEDAE